MAQLNKIFEEYKMEIMGVSEVRWNQSGETSTTNGNLFIYSGMKEESDPHVRGVGILLSKRIKGALVGWNPVSERIITARLRTKYRKMTIIQCYAPTEKADGGDKEHFYNLLDRTLLSTSSSDMIVLMGDFNARVGCNNEDVEAIMGKYGLPQLNENGELLVELCGKHGLVIGGTLFPHRECHKTTWMAPGAGANYRAQIDHICVSQKWRKSLLDVRNKRGADIGSDHHLIVGSLRMSIQSRKQGNIRRKKYEIGRLKEKETREQFKEQLQKEFRPLRGMEGTVEEGWQRVKNKLQQISQSVLGYATGERKEWISEETWKKIEERRMIKVRLNQTGNQGLRVEIQNAYKEIDKDIKKSVRRDHRTSLEKKAQRAQEAANKGDIKELYNNIREMTGGYRNTNVAVRDKGGNVITEVDRQVERWREHFREVLNFQGVQQVDSAEEQVPELEISVRPPSKREIITALSKMKNGKAAGMDNIPAEILKTEIHLVAEVLQPLFKKIWEQEHFPEDWKEGVIIKIPKRGDLSNCNNWRGITLLGVVSKIFNRIILNRIMEPLEKEIGIEQAGFRPNRSCIDHINTLRIIVEQSMEYQSPLYLAFVDYTKAFDSVERECIWRALKQKGIPGKIINLIKEGYNAFKCRVLHNGQMSTPFETMSGVRQGCLLSPLLFLVVLDGVLREVFNRRSRGITWKVSSRLEGLGYADDICLLAHNWKNMQEKLEDLQHASRRVGLDINLTKTEEIRINATSRRRLTLGQCEIKRVEDFTYLGSNISEDGGSIKDVKIRTQKARAVFFRLRKVWLSSNIQRNTKIKIFNACVKSVLLYGCETWLVSSEIRRILQSFINRCLRYICRIWWPRIISNEDLWKETGQVNINLEIRRRKYGWIGHTLRKDDADVAKSALAWNPQGSRKRGRPRNSWRRSVLDETGNKSWNELRVLAGDRKKWKNFVDDLCS